MVTGELRWPGERAPARRGARWRWRARGERRSEERWNAVGARGFKSWPAVPELPRRVDAVSGRRRRVAPRGGQALTRSGARRGASAGRRVEAGQRGAGLGWAEARRAALRDAGWAGFGRGPKARRRPAKEKNPFSFIFSRKF